MTKARVACVSREEGITESGLTEQKKKLASNVLNTCASFDKLHNASRRSSVDADPLCVKNQAEVKHHGETIERLSVGSMPPLNSHMPVPKVSIGESSILVRKSSGDTTLSRKIPITIFSFSNLLVQLHVDSVIMHALMLFPSILGHQKSVTCFLAQVVEQMGLRN